VGDSREHGDARPLTQWVTDHRKHHALSDRPGDPHSPHAGHGDSLAEHVLGRWHSHIGWLFSTKGLERGVEYGRDLYEDRLVRAIDRLYLLWVALTLGLPFLGATLLYACASVRRYSLSDRGGSVAIPAPCTSASAAIG
jgi:fatty-acid desaturase